MQVDDLRPTLQRAIQLARQAGLADSATELEQRCNVVCTTSSEWLGEVGEAILHFRSRDGKRIPAGVTELLDECLKEIGKVWPKYKPGAFGWFR